MAGMFGGKTQATTPQRYNGMQIGSSAYGGAVPLLYGRQRITFTLIWYGNFNSTPSNQGGGKGGGSQQVSSYNYSASWAAALCEGPVLGINNVYDDKSLTTLSAQGLTLFSGASGQATWSYLTSNFPAAAIPYDHTCYVAAVNYGLGSSAALPNLTFETDGFLGLTGAALNWNGGIAAGALNGTLAAPWPNASGFYTVMFSDSESFLCQFTNGLTAVTFTQGLGQNVTSTATWGGQYDCDPALMLPDYVSDPNHGAGRPASFLASLTGANSYQSYVRSLGLFLSPYEQTQRQASDYLAEILQITNSDAVWTVLNGVGCYKIIPYADAPVAGNGFSYTPNLTPIFIFGDDDYMLDGDSPPVKLTRKATASTYNHIKVEYLDRSNSYNTAIAEATDMDDINKNGERVLDTQSFHEICGAGTARIVAQLLLQANLYERNTYEFKTRADYSTLEPMDIVEVVDPQLGTVLIRITKTTDDPNGEFTIEGREVYGTTRTVSLYNWQAVQGYNANYGALPPSIQPPAFMEASSTLVDATGGRELWIATAPTNDANWGGCQIWMSFDNVTYEQIGIITSPSRYGIITNNIPAGASDHDTSTSINVQLVDNGLALDSGTAADADNFRILAAIDVGSNIEIISYASATLIGVGAYTLNYLNRGAYKTLNQAHAAGSQFMRLDGSITQLPIDAGWLGQTLYFKFPSYNIVGNATQPLATVPAYTYVPTQSAVAYNSSSQSTFSTLGSGVVYSPTTAFKRPNGSGGAWDSSVYAVQGYTDGCSAECYPSQTSLSCMMGLTLNPTASPSYTNLAYAWYFVGDGGTAPRLYIYESVNQVPQFAQQFGTYTANDLFAITHDGKHVCYWQNGNLIRSVPVGHSTFFMQIAFSSDNAAVYGMSFSSNPSNTAPFTIIPQTVNVAVSGTRVVSPTTAPNLASGWGLRTFQSKESYNNGCQVSFSTDTAYYQFIGLTANASAGTASYNALLAGWYIANGGGVVHLFFNGTDIGAFGNSAPASANEVFTITYDGFWLRWWRDGALQHQEFSANTAPLYLYGDIYAPGNDFFDISFGPYGSATPNPFIATGQCVTHDSTAQKVGGVSAWDSSVYSLNGFSNCHVQFKDTVAASDVMVGLATAPAASASYTNINFAIYCANGTIGIYQSGADIGNFGPYNTTDLFAITYDGATVRYYHNTTLIYQQGAVGLTLFMSSSFDEPGSGINSLSFGPGTALDLIPTAGMDANAASSMVSYYNASTLAPPPASPAVNDVVSTIGSLLISTTGSPVGVDVTVGLLQLFVATGTTVWSMKITVVRDGVSTGICPVASWDSGTIPWTPNTYIPVQPVSFVFVDANVPAGSHTYSVQLEVTNLGTGASRTQPVVGQIVIKLREIKR